MVDDDSDFREMMSDSLIRMGWDVVQYPEPTAALEVLKRDSNWVALVTDQIMPNIKGIDLIRRTKALHPKLPCILCTGYDETLHQAHASAAGAKDLLYKPFVAGELHGKLLECVPELV